MPSIILDPYLPGFHFDHVTVTIDDDRVSVVSIELDGSEVVRFQSRGYRPGLFATTVERQADDVISFACAYVEGPNTFDRSAEDGDIEQEPINRRWWIDHGAALACCLFDDIE